MSYNEGGAEAATSCTINGALDLSIGAYSEKGVALLLVVFVRSEKSTDVVRREAFRVGLILL